MKSRFLAMIVGPGCILAGLSAMATTPSEVVSAASTTTSAAPSAAASASAAKPPRPPPPVPLESQTIPREPSPRPTLEEWKNGQHVRVTRRSAEARSCEAYLVREWLKIKCTKNIAAVAQQSGNTNDVFFWVAPNEKMDWGYLNGGEVMFRMQPGDQRVIEFFQMIFESCFGHQAWPWVVVDETWLENEPHPTVVLR
ncbi:MAG TPA: hypothetical protein PK156_04935 [Polyangium sp.]|nr:hypothetical protein [Polyangium sp.]